MRYRATFPGTLFLLAAIIAAGFEVIGVYEYVTEQHGGAYMLVYCFIAAVTPALPACADWWWREGKGRYCVATWFAFSLCLLVVFVAAVQRTGSAADLAQQRRELATRAKKIAELGETDARSAYEAAQNAALKECADARGPRCKDAEGRAGELRTKLSIAMARLVDAPATQSNSLAKRIPWLTEEQVEALWPLLPPIIVSVLSALFFAGWQRIDFQERTARVVVEPEPVVYAPPEPERRVVPFSRPEPLPLPRPTPIRSVAAREALPVPKVFGSLKKFAEQCLAPAKGERLEVTAVIRRYRNWCKEGRLTPADPEKCMDDLERIYPVKVDGEKAYYKDVRLIA